MKKLISLISTKGKTPQQATKEVWDAFQKYQKTGEPTIKVEKTKEQTVEQQMKVLNSEAERDGELLVQEPSDSMQVHFFKKIPTYPQGTPPSNQPEIEPKNFFSSLLTTKGLALIFGGLSVVCFFMAVSSDGESGRWTAGFLIFLLLGLIFINVANKEDEIKTLKEVMHYLVYGTPKEQEEARSLVIRQNLSLKREEGKKV